MYAFKAYFYMIINHISYHYISKSLILSFSRKIYLNAFLHNLKFMITFYIFICLLKKCACIHLYRVAFKLIYNELH